MDARQVQRHFVAVMAKHLPPSAASLRLLDLDGSSGELLSQLRDDLHAQRLSADRLVSSDARPNAFDAVVGYDIAISSELLRSALQTLRPGGRLIILHSRGSVSPSQPRLLSDHGYTRILVEPALDDLGILLRGEKPHGCAATTARIQSVARADANLLDLEQFRGPYLHLLVQQQPNIPAWKMTPADTISWRAIAIQGAESPILLAFSSLPKAVAFMQPAVLAGRVKDINKVPKFSRASAAAWSWRALLNPTLESLAGESIITLAIDPATAEAPDE